MTFTVTYRGTDGAVYSEVVEATDRAECLAQMKARSVAVIGVNGRDARSPTPSGNGRGERVPYVLSVALVALAVVGGWVWWRWAAHEDTSPPEIALKRDPPKAALPKEVKPAAAPKPIEIPEKRDYAKLDNIALRRLPESETNNLSDAQVKYWRMFHPYPPPDPNKQPKAKVGHYKIFKSRADNDIAFLVATEPGTMVLGNRSVGPDFENHFLKSIETPIIVSDDDSEHDRALKRAVIAAKCELKAAYDRGEDIGKIMDDTRSEIQRIARYKAQLEKEILKQLHKDGTTAEDAEDAIAAMNKMLEAKGIAPLQLNAMSRIALKYQRMKRKTEETK